MTTETTIAGTILNQLGGRRFVAMTGAHSILNLGNGLQVKFKGSKRANTVRIELDANDLYTVRFYKIKGLDCVEIDSVELVHAFDLQRLFTRVTGLDVVL